MINAKDSKDTFYILNKKENAPIVLIHGVGLNHKIWEPQINSFKNTVLAYDILGHGNTPLTKPQISFDDFSLQLLNLIDELKFEKIHLVGFSIGSLIARNFASKYNGRLESLALIIYLFWFNTHFFHILISITSSCMRSSTRSSANSNYYFIIKWSVMNSKFMS